MVTIETFKSALEQMVVLEQNRSISCQIQLPIGWKTVSFQVVLRKACTYPNTLGYGFFCENFATGRQWQLTTNECPNGKKWKRLLWSNDMTPNDRNSKCLLKDDVIVDQMVQIPSVFQTHLPFPFPL